MCVNAAISGLINEDEEEEDRVSLRGRKKALKREEEKKPRERKIKKISLLSRFSLSLSVYVCVLFK